ncbi:flagellar hook-basal body complex protein FliE [Roseivivax isoporae]|uniref:Flagellar hook-basal body protein FliE n=1 Tax=Roseivivax isoporae LMG 25204 TaxID=1449351 RepID=X7FAE6_9RHOB|nr:flagellar hook-basal body complex protein FliE [Roseivivax isoporae]ETX29693.1 flagellar hook-basal body protein FliE [Roseivivax isoporae LMG 25204]
MDVRSLFASQSYAAIGRVAAPGTPRPDPVADFTETLRAAERTATEAMTGDADPHALVAALAQSELAVETAVTVRNKVVEAYQEILRMPV